MALSLYARLDECKDYGKDKAEGYSPLVFTLIITIDS